MLKIFYPLLTVLFCQIVSLPKAMAAKPYDPCNIKLGNFYSVPLAIDAPSSMRNEEGKWENNTRALIAAQGSKHRCKVGDYATISIACYCASSSNNNPVEIIQRAKVVWADIEEVAVDISQHDYEWLQEEGLYDHNNRAAGAVFYAECASNKKTSN